MCVIKREITRLSRLWEILDSMPKPVIEFEKGVNHNEQPYIKVVARNENGVCEYSYLHDVEYGYQDVLYKLLAYNAKETYNI